MGQRRAKRAREREREMHSSSGGEKGESVTLVNCRTSQVDARGPEGGRGGGRRRIKERDGELNRRKERARKVISRPLRCLLCLGLLSHKNQVDHTLSALNVTYSCD